MSAAQAQGNPSAEEVEISVGYETLLREYAELRPLTEADSAGPSAQDVAQAVAALATRRAPTTTEGVRRLEVDGLVVDQTLTRMGRDFYVEFFRLWAPPPEAVNYTIEIVEQPALRTSTAVSVQVNDELVFQTRLTPRTDDTEEDARQAVAAATRRLQRRSGPPATY